jgi:polygalacturonase
LATFNILDFSAVGDGMSNDAAAIQGAIDACTQAGGGTVLVPGGKTYFTGAFALKSNVELHVERGAVLQGSDRYADYTYRFNVGAM